MSLVYFETRDGHTMCLDRSRITGLTQNRTPTDTPTRVLVDFDPGFFDVRNGFDESQSRLMRSREPAAWIVHAECPWVTMDPPMKGGLPRTPLYK